MGNTQSSQGKIPLGKIPIGKIPLGKILDYVSANYILNSSFQDMKKLNEIGYCNNLVVITSKIMEKNLSNLEVEYLAQKLQGKKVVNYNKNEKVHFIPKNEIFHLDVRNKTQKQRMCNGIAKFYIKVAHVYAAIVTTIKPNGTGTMSSNHSEPSNMCNKRVKALERNKTSLLTNGRVNVYPSFCGMKGRFLHDESGIMELEELYFDDYDFEQGEFVGMTARSRRDYERDVKMFYETFTGKPCPPDIKTFEQIPLRDYRSHRLCSIDTETSSTKLEEDEDTKSSSSVSQGKKLKERLMKKYATHIQKMLTKAENKRNQLVGIIDRLFVFGIHPKTLKKEIMVNPELDMKMLDTIVGLTRKHIAELYADCEKDFVKGLDIFEAIVKTQIMQTSQRQLHILERKRNNMVRNLYDKPTKKKELRFAQPQPRLENNDDAFVENPTNYFSAN